jgi:hypothetical protein
MAPATRIRPFRQGAIETKTRAPISHIDMADATRPKVMLGSKVASLRSPAQEVVA